MNTCGIVKPKTHGCVVIAVMPKSVDSLVRRDEFSHETLAERRQADHAEAATDRPRLRTVSNMEAGRTLVGAKTVQFDEVHD